MKTYGLIFLLAIFLFSCTKKDDVENKSKDATLKSLIIAVGVWSTSFVSSTLNYVIEESNSVSNIDVSLEANNVKAKIVVNNETLALYKGSKNLSLTVGDNLYRIVVTAEDGITQRIYNINIMRKAL
jgi:PBP1b-binding outer membrane lipoprotein LpoB